MIILLAMITALSFCISLALIITVIIYKPKEPRQVKENIYKIALYLLGVAILFTNTLILSLLIEIFRAINKIDLHILDLL